MSSASTMSDRRFYRSSDQALLGGVCAGIARHMGFNLCMTRFLAFVAFLMAMPLAVAAYLAVVFLVPATSHEGVRSAFDRPRRPTRRARRRARRKACRESYDAQDTMASESSRRAASQIDRKCSALDERLARLEKHVTSKRFQLEQEFAKL